MRWEFLLALTLGSTLAIASPEEPPAVREFTVPAVTSTPYTYCILYLPHPEEPSFLKELKESPPGLFHLGYHIPFKGALGPTYGHELYTNEILPPEEISREVERIEAIAKEMRSAGVTRLIPYVYTMAFFGNADERTGFFHFFDHWESYRQFGLGPKPATDPALWTQQVGPQPLGGGPPGIFHYHPCINQPPWRDYLDLVVRQLAEAGYDGMFFDVNTEYCYCPHCQEKFDVYLLRKYGRAGLRQIFGTDDYRVLNLSTIYRDFEAVILPGFKDYVGRIAERDELKPLLGAGNPTTLKLEDDWRLLRCYMQGSLGEYPPSADLESYLRQRYGGERFSQVPAANRDDFVQTVLRWHFHRYLESPELKAVLESRFGSADIRRRCCGTPQDLLLWVETQRFWCDSMAGLFARLKEDGRSVFAAQGRQDDFYTVANLGSMATVDGLNKRRVDGIDLVRWAPMADLQMFEEMQQPGSLESGVILSNVFAFRWAMAAGTRAGTLLYKVADDRAADLAEAEVAAGGGGALIQAGLAAPDSRRRWKRFFASHAGLWDAGQSWARVGVLFWNDQVFYEYPEHVTMARRLVTVLSETQVPFDLIAQEGLGALPQYEVVFAPALRYVDDAQIAELLAYAKAGGNLVIVEPFGSEDPYARPRQPDPLAEITPQAGSEPVPYGEGRLLRLTPDAVPERRSEFWRLMEERANEFVRARVFLDAARREEAASGVDMGPEFVQFLESALNTRMRWCPPATHPGVYLHPYRLPERPGQPERIVVHAVNYRVPIVQAKDSAPRNDPAWSPVTKAGRPVAANRLKITVPLPADSTVLSVQALSPTEPPGKVAWSQVNGNVHLTVDRLNIYKALVVSFKPSQTPEIPH